MSRDGQIATVGAKGARKTSLLDLAIDFNHVEFIVYAIAPGLPRAGHTRFPDAPALLLWAGTLSRKGSSTRCGWADHPRAIK